MFINCGCGSEMSFSPFDARNGNCTLTCLHCGLTFHVTLDVWMQEDDVMNKIVTYIRNGEKIAAIKMLKFYTNMGLKEAKDEIERIVKRYETRDSGIVNEIVKRLLA